VSDALTALLDRVADAASKATPGARQVGRTLLTAITKRWTEAQWNANEEVERRLVFVGFTASDQGQGRRLIAQCDSESDVEHIVLCDPDLVSALVAVVRAAHDTHAPGCSCDICAALDALAALAESRARKEPA
jgi:hypothetical protein